MEESTMFEKATQFKFRFNSRKGLISAEDLWDLPLTHANGTSLDQVAKDLSREIKDRDVESFVEIKDNIDLVLETKLAIVKHIIKVRLAIIDTTKLAMETQQKRQQILTLIADKKNDELKGKTIEELEAMIKS